eukprot:4566279-Pleurochrysis_carterae.AAC.2
MRRTKKAERRRHHSALPASGRRQGRVGDGQGGRGKGGHKSETRGRAADVCRRPRSARRLHVGAKRCIRSRLVEKGEQEGQSRYRMTEEVVTDDGVYHVGSSVGARALASGSKIHGLSTNAGIHEVRKTSPARRRRCARAGATAER